MDMGSLPQWITLGVIGYGTYIALNQLTHNRNVRETENILKISDSTIKHNAEFLSQERSLKIIEKLEDLSVPPYKENFDNYWATRGVHLSHIHLVWRVWELAEKGKNMNKNYDGWERFAREIIAKKLLTAHKAVKDSNSNSAENLAASDIWIGLQNYEIFPEKFVCWLRDLSK